MTNRGSDARPVVTAGTVLGMGLGGFVDGILFHQLLQVHNMLSARYPKAGVDPQAAIANIEINMFWDGLFHAATWVITAVGLGLLWNAVRRPDVLLSTRAFVGSLAVGWGIFNLVEGAINHHVLHIHHVVEGDHHLPFDLAFLASGVVLILGGWLAVRSDSRTPVVVRTDGTMSGEQERDVIKSGRIP